MGISEDLHTVEEKLGYDPLNEEDLANPYDLYKRLREEFPVAYSRNLGAYIISDSDEIRRITRTPQIFSSEGTTDVGFGTEIKVLQSADDPLHRRQRSIVNAAFTTGRVAEMKSHVEGLADKLISNFVGDGECDIVEQFALQIPANVICQMMNFPIQDFAQIKNWTEGGLLAAADPKKYLEQAMSSALALAEYISEASRPRLEAIEKGQSQDDLLSAFLAAEIDGQKLTDQEIFFTCWQFLMAGHETTMSLISSTIYLFDQYPEQKKKFLDDPSLAEQAIEEVLRFESPAQAMPRMVKEDTEVSGVPIPAGSKIVVMFGSANRDPAKWDRPETFEITRPLANSRQKTLAFGFGPHMCIGANLSRLEAHIAIRKLYDRLPDIKVDDAKRSERLLNHFVRGWRHLYVTWDPKCTIS